MQDVSNKVCKGFTLWQQDLYDIGYRLLSIQDVATVTRFDCPHFFISEYRVIRHNGIHLEWDPAKNTIEYAFSVHSDFKSLVWKNGKMIIWACRCWGLGSYFLLSFLNTLVTFINTSCASVISDPIWLAYLELFLQGLLVLPAVNIYLLIPELPIVRNFTISRNRQIAWYQLELIT